MRTRTELTRERLQGRVEHVASGRVEHFTGEQQLWSFVFRIVNGLEEQANNETLPENGD